MMTGRTFTSFVKLCFACRDVWAEEAATENVLIRETRFREFKTWLLDAFVRAEPPSVVVDFFKMMVSPNDPEGYTREALKQYLDVRQNDRDYRAVASADVGDHDEDYRVRNLMEALIAEKESKRTGGSTMNVWICPFFTSRMQEVFNPRKKEIAHRTDRCTRFEQVLFLMGVSRLSFVFSSRRARKKRRVEGSSGGTGTVLESVTSFTGPISQKLGYGIQSLVRGWRAIALHFGFTTLEELITPYTRIVGPPFQFEVVSSRDEGFVPYSQLRKIEVNVSLTQTRSETFHDAFDRSVNVDGQIRALVQEFFNDFYSIILADGLYGETVWSHLKEYGVTAGGLPERFKRLDPVMVNAIENELMKSSPSQRLKTALPPDQAAEDLLDVTEIEPQQGHGDMETLETEREEGGGGGGDEGGNGEEHFKVLQDEMKKSFRMLCCPFEDLVEAHQLLYPRETLDNTVQLILTDPPFNIRRSNGFKNSSYDSLSVSEMDGVVELFDQVLRPGGHGIIFCTGQQFPLWVQKFNSYHRKNFVADKTALYMAWHPSSNKSFPGRWSTSLHNCVEQAVHVKKKGLPAEEEGEMVNYTNFNFVHSDYPGHKNVINNIRGLAPGEQVKVKDEESGKIVSLRNEQKPKALIQELISRFSQPSDLVLDAFSGTYATAVACFSLKQHRKFVGCEMDKTCFDHALRHVTVEFARTICKGDSDIKVAEEVRAAARKVVALSRRRKPDSRWMAPAGLPQYQAVHEHIVAYLANIGEDRSSYIRFKHKGVHDWPDVMQGKLQEAGVLTLRSIDALASGVVVQKSLIKYKEAGLGLFAIRSFGPGDVIGPFYGTLVYHNLLSRGATKKVYGSGVLEVTVERFRRYAIQLRVSGKHFGKVRDLMDGQKAISIVPAPFCAMGYANDYRYHPNDEEYGQVENPRKANAVFTGDIINHPDELVSPFTQIVKATDFINPGDEIYVDYGNNYNVFVNNCK